MTKEVILGIIILLALLSIGDDTRRTNRLLEQISKDIKESKK